MNRSNNLSNPGSGGTRLDIRVSQKIMISGFMELKRNFFWEERLTENAMHKNPRLRLPLDHLKSQYLRLVSACSPSEGFGGFGDGKALAFMRAEC